MSVLLALWKDDAGALIATEWVFVATILTLGIITGLVAIRQAAIAELVDFGDALLSLNQSFSFSGQTNCESSGAGAAFFDFCDSINTRSVAPACTNVGLGTACD